MWMVRAGRSGRWADAFVSQAVVGLGWNVLGDSTPYKTKLDLLSAMRAAYPEMSEGTALSGVNQLLRFRDEIKIGDPVITYDGSSRQYYIGSISGPAIYQPGDIEELTLRRRVEWNAAQVSRDLLSDDSKNRLGSVLTLFKVPEPTALELLALVRGSSLAALPTAQIAEEFDDPYQHIEETASERIQDRIVKLNWDDMQRLVAALLRALGYRTEISPAGPDRGKDIIASPDGFGFQQPRIVVEVKHRPGEKMDAPAIRSFLGGRHKEDRGLYVSTGGFSRDAWYEADRSSIPLKLMTLEELVSAVVENYDKFDDDGRALVPLKRVYWPI